MKLHLDTDLGGDPDDACALGMLLGWPGVELVGITTTIDPGGRRAGCVAHVLALVGRTDIPLTAGAPTSLSTPTVAAPFDKDPRYWPEGVSPGPSPPGAAVELLRTSIDRGATIVAIGPLTNLALLERSWPGALARARVVVMGGWVTPPQPGLPAWGPEMDWNIQWDTQAARVVATAVGDLTLTTLPATLQAPLRAADLPRLAASGALGELLARQCRARAEDGHMAALGRAHPGLPDDLVNFHFDPVAGAVALGWAGATVVPMPLRVTMMGELLRFLPDRRGRSVDVLVDVDGTAFAATWLAAVAAAQP